jgi:hypothetical protein
MMRMIIGVRSAGSAAAADHGGRELADLITRALHAQRLHADADEFWEQEDLADYPGVRDLVLEDVRSSIADPARCDKALRLLRAAGLSFDSVARPMGSGGDRPRPGPARHSGRRRLAAGPPH